MKIRQPDENKLFGKKTVTNLTFLDGTPPLGRTALVAFTCSLALSGCDLIEFSEPVVVVAAEDGADNENSDTPFINEDAGSIC